jgi:hypothetical protein
MTFLDLDADNYRIGKLNALQQFHIVRRLLPALASVGVSLSQLQSGASKDMGSGMEEFLPALGPVSEVLAKMTDEDTNYILFTCLSVVAKRQGSGGYAPTCTGSTLMFQDMSLQVMLRLAVEVVKANTEGFFAGLGDVSSSPSSSPIQTTAGTPSA